MGNKHSGSLGVLYCVSVSVEATTFCKLCGNKGTLVVSASYFLSVSMVYGEMGR